MNLKEKIRRIPDFPKKGIDFKDITPLLKDGYALKECVKLMADHYKNKEIDLIVSPEARGFILGPTLAYELGVGFVPVRKKGKLPAEVIRHTYEKEYGPDTIEIHKDAIKTGQKVLIVDDLLATGGTMKATAELIEKMGGEVVGMGFVIRLSYCNPIEQLKNYDIFSLIDYK